MFGRNKGMRRVGKDSYQLDFPSESDVYASQEPNYTKGQKAKAGLGLTTLFLTGFALSCADGKKMKVPSDSGGKALASDTIKTENPQASDWITVNPEGKYEGKNKAIRTLYNSFRFMVESQENISGIKFEPTYLEEVEKDGIKYAVLKTNLILIFSNGKKTEGKKGYLLKRTKREWGVEYDFDPDLDAVKLIKAGKF